MTQYPRRPTATESTGRFVSDRDGNDEIYAMPTPGPKAQVNADPLTGTGGSSQTRLTDKPSGLLWLFLRCLGHLTSGPIGVMM